MIIYRTVAATIDGSPIPVEMIFRGEDPYTVEFNFFPSISPVTWEFSKELLDELAENGISGEGDVRFILVNHNVFMRISSPEGTTVIEFHGCDIGSFLQEVNDSPELKDMSISDEDINAWLGA